MRGEMGYLLGRRAYYRVVEPLTKPSTPQPTCKLSSILLLHRRYDGSMHLMAGASTQLWIYGSVKGPIINSTLQPTGHVRVITANVRLAHVVHHFQD